MSNPSVIITSLPVNVSISDNTPTISINSLPVVVALSGVGPQGATGPAGAPGGVTSIFGRTGIVTAQSGDYSSFYDAIGSAATAQTNAEGFATAADVVVLASAESFATTAANNAQAAAEAYSSNANNLTSGTVSMSRLLAGVANGLATLDSAGKVPLSEIPAAVIGALNYQGAWNASTNSPTLTSSVGTKGYYYVVSVVGNTNLNGITDWNIGDWAVFNGSIWQKIDNTDSVISVNGKTGAVVLTPADIGAATAAQGAKADTAVQPGANISVFVNDANYTNKTYVDAGLATKQDTLVSGSNIKTINGTSILGSGNVAVGTVESVTGLNTDNANPANPIVKISVDGTTITGQGTPASPLVAIGGGGGGSPGGAEYAVQFNHPNGTFAGDTSNFNWSVGGYNRLGIQVANPLAPFHAASSQLQGVAAPSAITPSLTLDPAIDSPTIASAAMVTISEGGAAVLGYAQVDDPGYAYVANGSVAISVYIIPYKTIQGTQYYSAASSVISVTDNLDGQQCGFNYTWSAVDADGYVLVSSGSASAGNPNWTKDVGNVTSFLDDGTISASDPIPASFSAICFPPQNTIYTDPNSGSGSFVSDSSGQIANGSDWQVWVYGYANIYGQNYYSPSPFVIDLGTDPNDGNPYAASGSFSGGSYPSYLTVLYIAGSPVASQDIGGGTTFYITNGAVASATPTINTYTGTTWSFNAYGKVTSPSIKYSGTSNNYTTNDTNPPGGFIFIHTLSGFGNATNSKIIEYTPSTRGSGYIYDGATAGTVYQYNQALGDNVVTPATIGFQATGQTLTYDFYTTTTIYGTTIYSTPAISVPAIFPNDGLYYTVSFTGTQPSGTTLKCNKVGIGWQAQPNFGYVFDNTTVSWSGSGTITPTGATVPTGRIDWDSRNLNSGSTPFQIFDANTALVARLVMGAYYAGVGQLQAGWGYSANQNFVMDSYNHGLEIGVLGSPDFIFQTTGADFNFNKNSSVVTRFWGSGGGSPVIATFNPNQNTAYFGATSYNYDPFSSIAIQPYGTDTGLTFYPNSGVSADYLQWAVQDNASTILASMDGNGNMGVGTGRSTAARLNIAAGNGSWTQIKFANTTNLVSVAGGLVYTNTLNLSDGGLYLYDNALSRHQIVMSLPTASSGAFWFSDSLGNPTYSNAITTNNTTVVTIGSSFQLLCNGGVAISLGKSLTLGAVASPTASGNGVVVYDSTQKAIAASVGNNLTRLTGVIFTQTSTGTIANSTVETAITSTGIGSLTLAASYLAAGKTLKIRGYGIHSAVANPTIRIKIKFGATIILDTTAVSSGNSTNSVFYIDALITCRTTGSSGTVIAQGIYNETGGGSNVFPMSNTATVTVNTTASQAISITAQWGTASVSNTISLTNLTVEALN